jgi:hypothetical protein
MGGHCRAVCRNWTGSGTWSLGNPDGVVVVVKNEWYTWQTLRSQPVAPKPGHT